MELAEVKQQLVEMQQVLGDSDRQFAARLGIAHSYWTMVRNGKRGIGRKVLLGTIKAFPRLKDEAMDLLYRM